MPSFPGPRARTDGQTQRHTKEDRQTDRQTDRLNPTLLLPVPMSQTALISAGLRTKHKALLWEVYPPVCEMVSEHETRKVDAPEARTGAICHHSPQACRSILSAVPTPYTCMSRITVDMQLACNIHAAYLQHTCVLSATGMLVLSAKSAGKLCPYCRKPQTLRAAFTALQLRSHTQCWLALALCYA